MVKCVECKIECDGPKGEHIAFALWAAAIVLMFLFGIGQLVFIPFGLYFYIFHHSSKYVCAECRNTSCPDGHGELTRQNFCKKCNSAYCPYCGHSQKIVSKVPWPKAILLFLVSPIVIILVLFCGAINIWLFPVAYFFYEALSSPRCNNCNKRILLTSI
jgi:hypothetical protein